MAATLQPAIATSLTIATSARYTVLGACRALLNTTETAVSVNYREAGVLSHLRIMISANTSATGTFRIRVNAADGNSVVSVGSGLTGVFEDGSNSDTIDADDLVAISSIRTGTTLTGRSCCVTFTPTDTAIAYLRYVAISVGAVASGDTYFGVNTNTGQSATESTHQSLLVADGVFKNLLAKVSTNDSVTTSTLVSRINGADGAITVSISGLTTGTFEDVSNSDTVSAGDLYCVKASGATVGDAVASVVAIALETAADTVQYTGGSSVNTLLQGQTRFSSPGVGYPMQSAEAQCSFPVKIAGTASDFGVFIDVNSLDVSTTATFRINAGNGTQTFSIGSGATGRFTDAVHTDAVSINDLVALSFVAAAGTGSLAMQKSEFLLGPAAGGGGTPWYQTDGFAPARPYPVEYR